MQSLVMDPQSKQVFLSETGGKMTPLADSDIYQNPDTGQIAAQVGDNWVYGNDRSRPWKSPGEVISGAVTNLLPNAAEMVGSIGGAIAHPIRTINNIYDLGAGGVKLAYDAATGQTGPVTDPQREAARNFGENVNWAVMNPDIALQTHPLDVMAGLSGAGGVARSALGGAAKVAEMGGAANAASNLSKAARAAGIAAEYTDPVAYATSPLKSLGEGLYARGIGATKKTFDTLPNRQAILDEAGYQGVIDRPTKLGMEYQISATPTGVNRAENLIQDLVQQKRAQLSQSAPMAADDVANRLNQIAGDWIAGQNPEALKGMTPPSVMAAEPLQNQLASYITDLRDKYGQATGGMIAPEELDKLRHEAWQGSLSTTRGDLPKQLDQVLTRAYPSIFAEMYPEASAISKKIAEVKMLKSLAEQGSLPKSSLVGNAARLALAGSAGASFNLANPLLLAPGLLATGLTSLVETPWFKTGVGRALYNAGHGLPNGTRTPTYLLDMLQEGSKE